MTTENKYLLRRGGQQYGPYTLEVLLHYYSQGQILGTDLVWTEGRETWITVAQLSVNMSLGGESPTAVGSGVEAVTPRRTRRRFRAWVWGASAAAVVAALVVLVVLLSGPRPEDSLDHARAAYLQRDQVSFDRYVDVTSVLSDAVDQFIISGSLPQDSQSGGTDPATVLVAGSVSEAMHKVAASALSYQGIESKLISGTSATLDVRVATPLSSQSMVVKVRMQKGDGYWRVVAIEDLAGLLRELEGLSAQGAPSSGLVVAAPAPAPSAEGGAPLVPEQAAAAPIAAALPDPPVQTPAAPVPDDDPIGQGGFIAPPTGEHTGASVNP